VPQPEIPVGNYDHGAASLKMPVSKLMSTRIISCSPDDDIEAVFDLMDRHHIRHVPVFERGAVIGVLSIRDVLALRDNSSTAGSAAPAQYLIGITALLSGARLRTPTPAPTAPSACGVSGHVSPFCHPSPRLVAAERRREGGT